MYGYEYIRRGSGAGSERKSPGFMAVLKCLVGNQNLGDVFQDLENPKERCNKRVNLEGEYVE